MARGHHLPRAVHARGGGSPAYATAGSPGVPTGVLRDLGEVRSRNDADQPSRQPQQIVRPVPEDASVEMRRPDSAATNFARWRAGGHLAAARSGALNGRAASLPRVAWAVADLQPTLLGPATWGGAALCPRLRSVAPPARGGDTAFAPGTGQQPLVPRRSSRGCCQDRTT